MIALMMAAQNHPMDTKDWNFLTMFEFNGNLLLQQLINNLVEIPNIEMKLVVNEEQCRSFPLKNLIKKIYENTDILEISGSTKGAACSVLLAIEKIDPEDELLVVNTNEILDATFTDVINHFRNKKFDAGLVYFESLHPRYSYADINDDGLVTEVAEKFQISNHATAGFYWFKKGKYLTQAIMEMIRKNDSINSFFYVCPAFNQIILSGLSVGSYEISQNQYIPLKSASSRSVERGL